MTSADPWVGTWRPHRPKGPIAALHGGPGPKYALPGLTGGERHDPTKTKAPAISFGKRYEPPSSNCSPGPKYLIPGGVIRTGRDGTPAFSMHTRLKSPKRVITPGPDQYSLESSKKSVFRSAPAFTMYGRSKEICRKETPGPASYTLPTTLGGKAVVTSAAPAYTIGCRSKSRGFDEDLKKTPGPAAYKAVDPSTIKAKRPQYSMTGRNFAPTGNTKFKTPGPGLYHPGKVTLTKEKAPSFSFGVRHSQHILHGPRVTNEVTCIITC